MTENVFALGAVAILRTEFSPLKIEFLREKQASG